MKEIPIDNAILRMDITLYIPVADLCEEIEGALDTLRAWGAVEILGQAVTHSRYTPLNIGEVHDSRDHAGVRNRAGE